MKPLAPLALLAAAAVLLTTPQQAQSPVSASGDAAVRERGKQVFTDKCAQCHDADAARKLPDGTTLLGRLAASSDARVRLATRLNKMSPDDHRAVVLYVEELIARSRAGQGATASDHKN
jgi:mono/diheme cytochrome c family protein